jgi:Alpha amylase, catalytic domain
MTGWPAQPVIYEINTVIWLGELSRRRGRQVTLGDVPAEAWDEVLPAGVDAVWLMGVWERSPAGLRIAMRDQALQASWREALGDLRPDDVVGSPYCVRDYVVDPALGGPEGLAAARAELVRRGLRLLLDYVPNHVGPDHPWLGQHPECFVLGDAADLERSPGAFLAAGDHVLARGRDPFFPPWPDVVQLNAFSQGLRTLTVDALAAIGGQADGVRCDMAMLLMNEVFARTWGDRVGAAPAEDFWTWVLPRVRRRRPDMLFIAEAYWDLEWALQRQGFDHCYDKRLYDRLVQGDAGPVRAHLLADIGYQRGLVRFLENHDEPRAAAAMPRDRELAAATVVATLPGATLWHEGQFEGRRVRPPVFLSRRPDEPVDEDLRRFHRDLLAAVRSSGMRSGRWQALDCTGWPDNPTYHNLLAWCWTGGDRRQLVVVNFSDGPAQGRVPLPWTDLRGRSWRLTELLAGTVYERDGDELADPGLFVALDPWRWHLLSLQR